MEVHECIVRLSCGHQAKIWSKEESDIYIPKGNKNDSYIPCYCPTCFSYSEVTEIIKKEMMSNEMMVKGKVKKRLHMGVVKVEMAV